MTTAIDEIARLTLRVQELEAELEEADEELKLAEKDAARAENERDVAVAALEEAGWEIATHKATVEFIEDVRRGIRDLDEYEAVCS